MCGFTGDESEQLLHSQHAWGKKVFTGEGL